MNGSIAAIVTLGFGAWGSANLLPTLGYGVAAVQAGGLVCGTASVAPRVAGTVSVSSRVAGTVSVTPKVDGTVSVTEC